MDTQTLEHLVDIPYPQHPHCATILVLDTSASMKGVKIAELNEGLNILANELLEDDLAAKRIDLAIITFGRSVETVLPFTGISQFEPPVLEAGGYTPMGAAILESIRLIEQRKNEYREIGVDYYRPWIFLVTDGQPTDMHRGDARWEEVKTAIHEGEADRKFLFWSLGVDQANMSVLRDLSPPNRTPLQLKEARWSEMFLWLSRSLAKISDSRIGEQINLENPTGPDGWGVVPL
ncbi:MAG TPA: VWA domain-containing protein [Methanospirillum sp.]|nr:VWA domain-containing protein [Methanospirillum sp.]